MRTGRRNLGIKTAQSTPRSDRFNRQLPPEETSLIKQFAKEKARPDGAAQTFFSATPAQRADPYANYVLNLEPPGPVVPGLQARDQARLERLAAQNGSAEPVYPADELLVGDTCKYGSARGGAGVRR